MEAESSALAEVLLTAHLFTLELALHVLYVCLRHEKKLNIWFSEYSFAFHRYSMYNSNSCLSFTRNKCFIFSCRLVIQVLVSIFKGD